MKREKEFKEYLKDKRIELTSCIKKYEDYNIKDENGNMVRVEPVCVGAGKDMVITWKDTKTGNTYKTTE